VILDQAPDVVALQEVNAMSVVMSKKTPVSFAEADTFFLDVFLVPSLFMSVFLYSPFTTRRCATTTASVLLLPLLKTEQRGKAFQPGLRRARLR